MVCCSSHHIIPSRVIMVKDTTTTCSMEIYYIIKIFSPKVQFCDGLAHIERKHPLVITGDTLSMEFMNSLQSLVGMSPRGGGVSPCWWCRNMDEKYESIHVCNANDTEFHPDWLVTTMWYRNITTMYNNSFVHCYINTTTTTHNSSNISVDGGHNQYRE